MTKQNLGYGIDVQKLYLEIMLTDSETFVRCQSIFDYELFDFKLKEIAKFINEYASTYNVLPTYEMVNASTHSSLKLVKPTDLVPNHYDWVLDEFETFIRHKGLERAIIQGAELVNDGEYGAVEDIIKKAMQVGLTKDLGTDYFSDPKTRLLKIKDSNGQMSSGWTSLDSILYGGFNRGELNIFAAISGGGKSLFLANLGINYCERGMNVLYLTLELSEELVSMRIDAMITGTPTREIFKHIDDVDLKVRTIGKKCGEFQIKYMPSGKNANDLRAYMKEYEIKNGKKIDVLIVDYLDLLYPMSKKISAENLFIKDKFVSEELRNLAIEKNCLVISAAQINRSGVDEVEFDQSNIAGGISKIQTADNVFGIFTSRAMRERGTYQLQLLKTRNSSGVGQKLDLDFNIDTLRITDAGTTAQPTTTPNNIINNFKRSANVISDDPTDGSNVKKITAEIGSTQIKALLNNLHNDDY